LKSVAKSNTQLVREVVVSGVAKATGDDQVGKILRLFANDIAGSERLQMVDVQ